MERNPLDASNSNGNVECTLTRRQKSFSCSWCALDNGEKTLSYLLAFSPPRTLSVPLSILRSLSFYRQLSSFRQPLSGLLPLLSVSFRDDTRRRRWERRRRKRRSKRAVEEEDERTTRKRKPPEYPPLTFLLFLRAGSFSFSIRKKRRVGGAGTHMERTKITREVRFETRYTAFVELPPVLVSKETDDKEGVGVAFRNSRKLQCWMRRGATLFTTPFSFFLFPCYFFPFFLLLFSFFHLLPEGPDTTNQEQRRRFTRDRRRPWHRAKKTVICSSGAKRGLSLSSPHCHLRLNADKCISHSTRCFVPKNFFFSIRPMVSSFKRLFAPKGTVLLSPWGNYKPL